jgi:hypothetical protein
MNAAYIDRLLEDARLAAERGDMKSAEVYKSIAIDLIREGRK